MSIGSLWTIIAVLIGEKKNIDNFGGYRLLPHVLLRRDGRGQVHEYCPRHSDNLVAVGENARGGA